MKSERAKLYDKVKEVTNTGCWRTLATSSKGYGSAVFNGRQIRLHQLSYTLHKGNINAKWVLHTCDVKDCINPEHLFLGSPSENQRDRFERNPGNVPKGEKHSQAKLNLSQVDQLRRLYRDQRWTLVELASTFHVSRSQVYRIIKRKKWTGENKIFS